MAYLPAESHRSTRAGRPVADVVALGWFLAILVAGAGTAQQEQFQNVVEPDIQQQSGVDQSVDYASMARIGPWDDRNYQVTAQDMQLLAPNEAELREPLPVFFRVAMRRAWPELPREGPAQYPRSALQIFQQLYGGFQVGNRTYSNVTLIGDEFVIVADSLIDRPLGARADLGDRFLSGEVRVTSPVGAAESAVKMSPVNPDIIIAGSNGPGSGQKMHFSSDGGATWTETTLPLGGTCCDPTVDWKSDGSLAHTATLGNCGFSGCAVWFYRSSDDGQTWTDLSSVTPGDPRRELTNSGSDKEFLHVDKHPTSPRLDNLYLTWHDANVMQFARSTDDGNTWTTTSFTADPRGIGSDIVTDSNGNVYYFWPGTTAQQILLKRSTDGGATFPAGTTVVSATNGAFDFPIPSMETRRAWIYVSADADLSGGPFHDSIYVAWTDTTAAESGTAADNHTRIQVAFSRDGGATWTIVTPHETADAASVDRWNQWLAVAPDGSVHVVFYDTRNDPSRQSVDLYHSMSTDGGQTFGAPERLTTQTSPNLTDAFEFGDYNGLDAVMNEVITVYTDNRDEGGGGGNSEDIYAIGSFVSSAEPNIQIPGGVTFPATCSGATNTEAMTVCNTGTADLLVDAVTSSSPVFSVPAPSSGYPVVIAPSACFPFQVAFSPTVAGPQSGTLTVTSNDPDTPSVDLGVDGDGTEQNIQVGGSTDWGWVSGWAPSDRTVSVCNLGHCDLEVTSATIDCSDFSFTSSPIPATVPTGACVDLVIDFTPTVDGPKSCQLTITSDDPDTPVVTRPLTARTPPHFSLHGGVVDPHGALASHVRHGSTLQLDFVYPVTSQWAWDIRLGVSRFDGRSGSPDVDVWNLSANARFTLNPSAPVRVFLNGGPGIYHFDPGSLEGAGNLGLGLNVPINSVLRGEATYNYHTTFTASPTHRFSQFQLGILVSF